MKKYLFFVIFLNVFFYSKFNFINIRCATDKRAYLLKIELAERQKIYVSYLINKYLYTILI